jgi:DNA-binding CsgD family transcriptional regulator
MNHIVILGHLVILLVGTWALFLAYQTYKRFQLLFLRFLVSYIVFFNIAVFVYLIAQYTMVNVFTEEVAATDHSAGVFLMPVLLVVELGLTYTLVQVVTRLQGLRNLGWVNRAFTVAALLFAAGYLLGLMRLWRTDSIEWLMGTTFILVLIIMITIIGTLAVAAVRKYAGLDAGRRKAIRAFATMMLLGYIAYIAFSFLRDPYEAYGSVANQLWLNFVPIIWIQYFFLPYYAGLSTGDEDAVIENLVREYSISKREREIMELIVAGKSNKEIEEQLFISVNTVKNHVYHLYQKLGIKSRSQLMHLVLKNNHIGSDRS